MTATRLLADSLTNLLAWKRNSFGAKITRFFTFGHLDCVRGKWATLEGADIDALGHSLYSLRSYGALDRHYIRTQRSALEGIVSMEMLLIKPVNAINCRKNIKPGSR
jgi:hypothetical protein